MKYCEKCHVYVKGGSICPLCQTRLPGEGEPSLYPHISRKISGMNLAFRILLLISIAGGSACLALNRMLPESGFWSLYVILGILSFWIIFPLFCRHRGRVPRLIAEQSVVLLLLIIFWDGITGWRGWSVSMVWPVLLLCALTCSFIYAKARKLSPEEYAVCHLLEAILSVIPSLLFIGGAFSEGIPSLIAGAVGFAMLAALFLFDGRVLRQELSRRFHI